MEQSVVVYCEIPCRARGVKRTHGVEGFLGDPADVHVIHVAGSLLDLHRNSPLLKIEKYHVFVNTEQCSLQCFSFLGKMIR